MNPIAFYRKQRYLIGIYLVIICPSVSCARAPRENVTSIFVRSLGGNQYHGTCPASSLAVGIPVEEAEGTVVVPGILVGRNLAEAEGIVVVDGPGEDTAATDSLDVDAPARRGIVDHCGSAVDHCMVDWVPARCRCRVEDLDGSCPAKTGLDNLRPSVFSIQALRH